MKKPEKPQPKLILDPKVSVPGNNGLHNLNTRFAFDLLKLMRETMEQLSDMSNLNADEYTLAIGEVMRKQVAEDAAFRDAAAMLFSGMELPPEE